MPSVEKILDRIPSSKRAVWVAVAVLVALVFALIGVLFWQVHSNSSALDNAAAVARARGQALGTANAKLTQNGIPAVQPTKPEVTEGQTDVGPTTPSSTPKPGPPGAQGVPGERGPGPTTQQVAAAVADYCAAHSGCASGPTKAQVAAAVLTFCGKHDDCAGPTGAAGEPGPSGTTGDPGRAPTPDEISAAVATYCADDACRGPKGDTGDTGDTGPVGPTGPAGPAGADGQDGADGTDAPHFTKIECTADNAWRFTLSDGSTLTAAGPCRASTTTVTVTAPPSSPDPSSTAPGQNK